MHKENKPSRHGYVLQCCHRQVCLQAWNKGVRLHYSPNLNTTLSSSTMENSWGCIYSELQAGLEGPGAYPGWPGAKSLSARKRHGHLDVSAIIPKAMSGLVALRDCIWADMLLKMILHIVKQPFSVWATHYPPPSCTCVKSMASAGFSGCSQAGCCPLRTNIFVKSLNLKSKLFGFFPSKFL